MPQKAKRLAIFVIDLISEEEFTMLKHKHKDAPDGRVEAAARVINMKLDCRKGKLKSQIVAELIRVANVFAADGLYRVAESLFDAATEIDGVLPSTQSATQ